MDTLGGVTISKEMFPRGVFVVLSVKASDATCKNPVPPQDASNNGLKALANLDRIKTVTFS